jgi:hypothetical protein
MSKFSKDRWEKVSERSAYYHLTDKICFGKYRIYGYTLRELIEIDVQYVRYLIDNCDKVLDNEAFEYFQKFEEN